ncbi:MAG: hypothetical protein KF819_06645 [Labilithrix sp.]|nr:hypothetical protein [Labilithrix sp.]
MSARLDDLIEEARGGELAWDEARAARVREGAIRRGERRRLARRGVLVASGAALLVVGLLRAASSAPARVAEEPAPAPEIVAARGAPGLGDAGYARD